MLFLREDVGRNRSMKKKEESLVQSRNLQIQTIEQETRIFGESAMDKTLQILIYRLLMIPPDRPVELKNRHGEDRDNDSLLNG